MIVPCNSLTYYVARSNRVSREEATHLTQLSRRLQQTMMLKYKELSTVINNWRSEQKKLGHSTPTSRDFPTYIHDAGHKLNIIRKVLKHEWQIDL